MRFFIALEIPEESRQELAGVQERLKELFADIRITDTPKMHLTIAFIGEQAEDLKEQLIEVMNEAAKNITPFEVTPAYIDGFPSLHHARVIWVGVKGDIDKLMVIRERIKDGLLNLELPVDERRYTPHITIAKASDDFHLTDHQEKLLQEMMLRDFKPIQISSIKLFESVPNMGFHDHNTLAEIQLS
jgi:RNA 2',3'-cyclic 3'-phosphodiesterase